MGETAGVALLRANHVLLASSPGKMCEGAPGGVPSGRGMVFLAPRSLQGTGRWFRRWAVFMMQITAGMQMDTRARDAPWGGASATSLRNVAARPCTSSARTLPRSSPATVGAGGGVGGGDGGGAGAVALGRGVAKECGVGGGAGTVGRGTRRGQGSLAASEEINGERGGAGAGGGAGPSRRDGECSIRCKSNAPSLKGTTWPAVGVAPTQGNL